MEEAVAEAVAEAAAEAAAEVAAAAAGAEAMVVVGALAGLGATLSTAQDVRWLLGDLAHARRAAARAQARLPHDGPYFFAPGCGGEVLPYLRAPHGPYCLLITKY